uniref:Uncharacterized protein n=1 Tax=Glossina pallidipes TaxID=7398 RepID=A0A1B0AJR6_GLOPL
MFGLSSPPPLPQRKLPATNCKRSSALKVSTKFKKIIQTVKAFLTGFFNESTIHGVKYFAKSELTAIEKIGLESVDKYYTKSTVVGLERNYYYWNTTMPSVTICPLARLNRRLFDDYTRRENVSDSEAKVLFNFLETLANTTYSNIDYLVGNEEIDRLLDRLQIQPENYMKLIYNLTGDDTLRFVADISSFMDKIHTISGDLIIGTRQILTEYGLCYMTNTMLSDKYSSRYMVEGILPDKDIQTSPSHINVKKCSYFENDVNYNVLGFDTSPINVFLHSPFDVMKADQNLGYTGESLQLRVTSTEIVTEDEFEFGADVKRRKCRFQHENNLTHFPIFTRNLCQQECRLNLVFKVCKCIPHFYAKSVSNPKPVCDYKTLKNCLGQHKDYFVKLYRTDKETNKRIMAECYCYQNCVDSMVSIRTKYIMANTNALVGGTSLLFDMVDLPKERLIRRIIFSFEDLLGNKNELQTEVINY